MSDQWVIKWVGPKELSVVLPSSMVVDQSGESLSPEELVRIILEWLESDSDQEELRACMNSTTI